MKKATSLLVLLFLFISIGFYLHSTLSVKNNCAPPEDFHESDMIGNWQAGLSEKSDTLVIRDDGYYQQIIHREEPAFNYISEWQPWHLEFSDYGTLYLHLENMKYCVYWPQIPCEQTENGEISWYDFCKDEWVKTPGEGLLIVLPGKKGYIQPPKGIQLFSLQKDTVEVTVYKLMNR